MKKWLIRIVTVIFIITFILSIAYIIKNKKEDKEQNEIFEELENIVADAQITDNKEQQEEKINLYKLYELNNDFIGWLKIDNSNISYPIMQTKDRPNYYLDKNFYEEYSFMGTPYINENCSIENSDNVIIYGHHIKGNKMFGELENYKNEDYYKNHKIIKFYTNKEIAKYEIIAVFKTTVYDNIGFKYYQFYNMESKEEFNTFVSRCKELSFYDTQKSAEYGDKLITLSTCEYSNENSRLVVVAKKITNELEE